MAKLDTGSGRSLLIQLLFPMLAEQRSSRILPPMPALCSMM